MWWGVWCIYKGLQTSWFKNFMVYKLNGLQTPEVGRGSVRSQVVWEDFLVLQVFLQRNAARHSGCELDVVHQAGTRVASEVFFDDLFANPPNPGDKASDGCGVEERFYELVVGHGCAAWYIYGLQTPGCILFKIHPRFVLPTRSLVQSCLRSLFARPPAAAAAPCASFLKAP